MLKLAMILMLSSAFALGAKKAPISRPATKPPVYKKFKQGKKERPKVKWGAQRDLNP